MYTCTVYIYIYTQLYKLNPLAVHLFLHFCAKPPVYIYIYIVQMSMLSCSCWDLGVQIWHPVRNAWICQNQTVDDLQNHVAS